MASEEEPIARKRPTVDASKDQAIEVIAGLVDAFCKEHLNDEYADLCRKLTERLARKRPSPLFSGRPSTWACGIFLPDFLKTTSKQYGAELAQVDFVRKPEESRQEINAWVERQTNDKIKDLMPPNSVTDQTRLVLTNAIYFKGKWQHEFSKTAAADAPFTVAAKEKVAVPLMFQKERFKYGETVGLQLLEMGYKGDGLSMLVLLPKKVDGLQLAEQFQLNSTLAKMGVPSAFDPGTADFSGMNGKRDLFISIAVHKAFVDVNEEGTEVAAATGVGVAKSIAAEPKTFRADHPFVFMIRENSTGSILFMGRVTNPKR